ncbi:MULTISPECIES: proteasome assembly chaperone family protein [Arthrobacter]|uniref:proteasome assembly chaperone family protein n=1 Tax=unclassified Arthrobacter TaxID=235627 RepID=UPI0024B883FC|nr:PAC2 family protein [Arthrobacter sp. H35-MC1]MDJ0318130.1 PAC2 family protein [Arthrobacter sp. H35-MC1]
MNINEYTPFQDPESLYVLNEELIANDDLKGANLLMSFTGFSDAGQVVSQIASELKDQLSGEALAIFDIDQLIDYRSRRPRITFTQDRLSDYKAPSLALYRMVDALGTPFLYLCGNEPDLQWERFSLAVLSLVERFDVNLVAWAHSVPMPVPHSRPIGATVHGNRPDLIEGISAWKATLEIPSAIGHVLEFKLDAVGRNVVGYAVHVPHYLSDAEYPPAAVAGLEYLGAAASLMLPSERLREAGRAVERQITEQVEGSAEVATVVKNLETQYDEHADGNAPRSLLAGDNDELPDADELGAAVEAYLASRDSGSLGGPEGGLN